MTEVLAHLAAYGAAFLAALLTASAVHKIGARARLAASAVALVGVPGAAGPILLWAAIVAELAAAAALIVPAARTAGALAASLIWALYLALIVRALAGGRTRLDCGCNFGRDHPALTAFEPARNVVLVGFALAVAAAGRHAPPSAIGLTEGVAGLAALTLYAAVDQIAPLGEVAR